MVKAELLQEYYECDDKQECAQSSCKGAINAKLLFPSKELGHCLKKREQNYGQTSDPRLGHTSSVQGGCEW